MNPNEKKLWIDTRLSAEHMDFLWQIISEENKEDWRYTLAGNISKSEKLVDKDNWFFKSALKKLTERMFYRDWDNFSKYHIEKEEGTPLPEFGIERWWVNYQNQYEFSDFHNHTGLYSFVIFIKIPTHYSVPTASNFQFVWSEKNTKNAIGTCFQLSPEDEGRMLFFPGTLQHKGVVTHNTEEERITISGNIHLYNPKKQEIPVDEYEKKDKMLKMLENSVQQFKEELKMMKKVGEKEE